VQKKIEKLRTLNDFKYINSAAGGSNNGRLPPNGLYLNAHQSRDHEPTTYENILADAIERAYAAGIHDLNALVKFLNESGTVDPNGNVWNKNSFQQTIKEFLA
jgi:hypothetical protein